MKLKIKNVQRPFLFDPSPKFEGWSRQQYLAAGIPEVEPMLCKEYDEKYLKKYPGIWVASEKLDGHRCIGIKTENGFRFFSRRISKVTGWYSENSDCVPHLRDAETTIPNGTIIDGELLFDWNCTSKDVQSVTGALPQKAISYQQERGFLQYNVFDVLQYGLTSLEGEKYRYRLNTLEGISLPQGFKLVSTYYWKPEYGENFRGLLEQLWEEGKEGLVLKNLESKYEQGKRSPQWLKLKEVKTFDVIITGFQEPTREYSGKAPENWIYKEKGENVTKPYAMKWIGAIEFGLLRDGEVVKIAEAKGISDADQEYIKANREELIGTVIEVKAQGIIDPKTNSLRHPRFKQFRPDKNPEECKWEGFGE